MRILVCGGRDYADLAAMSTVLRALIMGNQEHTFPVTIIHGGARGADALAGHYARTMGFAEDVYMADWEREGRSAGVKRNARMLKEAEPDVVVAFPGGRGTADMVARAKRAGVRVVEVEP